MPVPRRVYEDRLVEWAAEKATDANGMAHLADRAIVLLVDELARFDREAWLPRRTRHVN